MIRLKDITLPFDHKEEALASSILERLGIPEHQLLNFTIIHKSMVTFEPLYFSNLNLSVLRSISGLRSRSCFGGVDTTKDEFRI